MRRSCNGDKGIVLAQGEMGRFVEEVVELRMTLTRRQILLDF